MLLLHSPLLAAAATWGALPGLLGEPVLVPEVTADDAPPYADRYVASVAAQAGVMTGSQASDVAVLAHSGAGPLVPAVVAALGSAGVPVRAAVFLDAGLPRPGATRLELLEAEGPEAAAGLRELLDSGGRFPDWTPELLAGLVPDPAAVLAAMRPRGADFFAEPLPETPLPADLRYGYVQLSPTYRQHADGADALGWPVQRAVLGHLAALSAPDRVADLVRRVR